MKKTTLFLIALVTFLSLHTTSVAEPITELKIPNTDTVDTSTINNTFKGYKNGKSLIQNISFSDVNNHEYKDDIIKLASLSIIKGYGNSRFYPNNYITKEEALIFLVRALGLEEQVRKQVYENNGGYGEFIYRDLREEYTNQAINMGIIGEDENYNLTTRVSRETILRWIGKAIKIDPIYDDIQIIPKIKNFDDINPNNIGIIEALLQDGIYDYEKQNNLNLKENIKRSEMAYLLSKVMPNLYEENDINIFNGSILDKEETNENTKIVIDTQEEINAIDLTKDPLTNEDIVVYSNGKIMSASDLNIRDEIEYIVRNDEVLYIEVKSNGSLPNELINNNLEDNNINRYDGTIVLINKGNLWKNDTLLYIKEIYIRNDDGKEYKILIERENPTEQKNDIIVYKGSNFGGSDLLEEGNEIKYTVKDNQNIISVEVKE